MILRCALYCAALAVLAGCSALQPNPVPPAPSLVGDAAADTALVDQIERTPDGARFRPLIDARQAVAAAEKQPKVQAYDAESLAEAQSALAAAETGWGKMADQQRRPPARLATIAADAHRAQRLAEIARFTAMREINLDKLLAANKRLEARARQTPASAEQSVAALDGEDLINTRVVPDRLGDISFESGTARMTAASRQVAERLAALMRNNPDYGVALLGHTDDSAPADATLKRFVDANPKLEDKAPTRAQQVKAFNLALSSARARVVARTLVENGVDANRIGARGFGGSRPVASNDTAEGRDANRRIEAVIVAGPDRRTNKQGGGRNTAPAR